MKTVKVLKKYGCDTIVVSTEFLKRHSNLFETRRERVVICPSQKGVTEEASEIMLERNVRVVDHTYTSNWAIYQTRYEVLVGIPWNAVENLNVDYRGLSLMLKDIPIPVIDPDAENRIDVFHLGVRKFRRMLRQGGDSKVFRILEANKMTGMKDY